MTFDQLQPGDKIELLARTLYVQRLLDGAVECRDEAGRTFMYGSWNNLMPTLFLRVWRGSDMIYERENK